MHVSLRSTCIVYVVKIHKADGVLWRLAAGHRRSISASLWSYYWHALEWDEKTHPRRARDRSLAYRRPDLYFKVVAPDNTRVVVSCESRKLWHYNTETSHRWRVMFREDSGTVSATEACRALSSPHYRFYSIRRRRRNHKPAAVPNFDISRSGTIFHWFPFSDHNNWRIMVYGTFLL